MSGAAETAPADGGLMATVRTLVYFGTDTHCHLALADGTDCSYICDVAVMPSHQGTGLGKAIVARLLALSAGHKKIILYAVPGKEPFYKKFGFRRMRTAMAIFENQALAAERGYIDEP